MSTKNQRKDNTPKTMEEQLADVRSSLQLSNKPLTLAVDNEKPAPKTSSKMEEVVHWYARNPKVALLVLEMAHGVLEDFIEDYFDGTLIPEQYIKDVLTEEQKEILTEKNKTFNLFELVMVKCRDAMEPIAASMKRQRPVLMDEYNSVMLMRTLIMVFKNRDTLPEGQRDILRYSTAVNLSTCIGTL